MVYKKSIKWLHLEHLKEHPTIDCSLSTFVKYRPFYIEVPIEREKILLVHCMLKCTYKIIRNQHFSKTWETTTNLFRYRIPWVTRRWWCRSCIVSERSSKKNVNYYVFESVLESYVKEGVTLIYTRTTRVDKNESVYDIYADLVDNGERYLYHRSTADNIKAVLPKVRKFYK